jgi:hypothetical protein
MMFLLLSLRVFFPYYTTAHTTIIVKAIIIFSLLSSFPALGRAFIVDASLFKGFGVDYRQFFVAKHNCDIGIAFSIAFILLCFLSCVYAIALVTVSSALVP